MIEEEDLKKGKPEKPEGTMIDFFFEEVVPHIIKNRDRLDKIDVEFGMVDVPKDGWVTKERTGHDKIIIKLKPR